MNCSLSDSNLSEDLVRAIERKGYETLTPIQQAVLEVDSATADLRITSMTGSGKTLAIGFALRNITAPPSDAPTRRNGPLAVIIVPTRELAKQVQGELTWLFQERRWRVECLTGGTSVRDERRALSAFPAIIVATPGRLLDHLNHGVIKTEHVAAVVLDEADRMLDMGFSEDLKAILDTIPSTRQTHMASATFCDEVGRLANRYQRNAILLQGAANGNNVNEDIEHVVHLVYPGQKLDAIVNLLLSCPTEQFIIFTRTRADVNDMGRELSHAGFDVVALSGEMSQPERDRALAVFRRGSARILVATDVAARGLDIQGVTQIIHLEPPTDPDSYVHRSGRTGRAGHKGTSRTLVVPAGLSFVKQLMRRAGTKFRMLPIPTAESLLAAREQSMFLELATQPAAQPDVVAAPSDARTRALAERLCGEANIVDVVARLLMRIEKREIEPRSVRSPQIEMHAQNDMSRSAPFKKPFGKNMPFGKKQKQVPFKHASALPPAQFKHGSAPPPAQFKHGAPAPQQRRKQPKVVVNQPAPW